MDGILIINKEKEWTSNDVVQKVKHLTNKKVGHTGTLDPLATGVLPILVGKGTLLSKYLINHDKEYIATVKLGEKTSTGDSEGKIIEIEKVSDKTLDTENLKKVLKEFKGEQIQMPPMYSAIKVNGKKLYEYARKGQEIKVDPRKIFIYNIELLSVDKEKMEVEYKVECSKGTYIRSLCEDIAKKLGTVGYMKSLNRTRVGDFNIKDAIKISEIDQIEDRIISIEEFFKKKDPISLDEKHTKQFLNGILLDVENADEKLYRVYSNNNFIGIAIGKNGKLKRDIII